MSPDRAATDSRTWRVGTSCTALTRAMLMPEKVSPVSSDAECGFGAQEFTPMHEGKLPRWSPWAMDNSPAILKPGETIPVLGLATSLGGRLG